MAAALVWFALVGWFSDPLAGLAKVEAGVGHFDEVETVSLVHKGVSLCCEHCESGWPSGQGMVVGLGCHPSGCLSTCRDACGLWAMS